MRMQQPENPHENTCILRMLAMWAVTRTWMTLMMMLIQTRARMLMRRLLTHRRKRGRRRRLLTTQFLLILYLPCVAMD